MKFYAFKFRILNFQSINRVVERDNITREIPLLYRDCLELDVSSEEANGKVTVYRDGLVQVQACNIVRRTLEGGCWQGTKVTPTALHKVCVTIIFGNLRLWESRVF